MLLQPAILELPRPAGARQDVHVHSSAQSPPSELTRGPSLQLRHRTAEGQTLEHKHVLGIDNHSAPVQKHLKLKVQTNC